MARRRTMWISLSLLGLILFGTVVVLSSVSYYLAIPQSAYITEAELNHDAARANGTLPSLPERIPRILHQTWKSETLPERWKGLAQGCRDMMPDYEYMLWTDASSREFVAEHYPWFLDTFDGYEYPIQRADAIRYFILHHYGGVYLDLDVGCLRPLDPLLVHSVILPKTIPVGVSNDLMFSEKGHPFMAQTIHNLITFDHSWILNYPTVMFSTGPMFLSAQFGLYASSHPEGSYNPSGEVRVLPKALYGKNAKPEEAPNAFFAHYYGSSWHADDAAFVGFLGHWGKIIMVVGLIVLVLGVIRLALPSSKRNRYRRGDYQILLPRWSQSQGRWQIDLGLWSSSPTHPHPPQSPVALPSPVPSLDDEDVISLPLSSLHLRPPSPSPSEVTDLIPSASDVFAHPAVDAVWRATRRAIDTLRGSREDEGALALPRSRRSRARNVFYLPAIFAPPQDADVALRRPQRPSTRVGTPPPPRYTPALAPEKLRHELESLTASADNSLAASASSSHAGFPPRTPPPPPAADSSESSATSYFVTPGVNAFAGARTPSVSRPPSRGA